MGKDAGRGVGTTDGGFFEVVVTTDQTRWGRRFWGWGFVVDRDAKRLKQATALKGEVVFGRTVRSGCEIEVGRLPDVLGDVMGSMSGGFDE